MAEIRVPVADDDSNMLDLMVRRLGRRCSPATRQQDRGGGVGRRELVRLCGGPLQPRWQPGHVIQRRREGDDGSLYTAMKVTRPWRRDS